MLGGTGRSEASAEQLVVEGMAAHALDAAFGDQQLVFQPDALAGRRATKSTASLHDCRCCSNTDLMAGLGRRLSGC